MVRKQPVTQAEIAKKLKVSQSSVSRVIRGRDDLLRPELVDKIRQALREANYTPHQAALALRQGRSGLIGMFLPNLRHPVFVQLARRLYTLANQAGYLVIMFNAEDNIDSKQSMISQAVSFRVEGLIMINLFPAAMDETKKLQENIVKNFPTVDLYGHCELDCPRVLIDSSGAMEMVMNHLFELGHRHIAFAAFGRQLLVEMGRWRGIQLAYRKRGLPLPVDEDFFPPFSNFGHRAHAAGVESAQAILQRRERQSDKEKYTAIVAINDSVAIGVIRCLADHGLKVPQDISVVGFDNLEESSVSIPRLTTIDQPLKQMAELGFDMLMKQVDDNPLPKSQVIPMELIVRDSTAKAPRKVAKQK